MLYSDKTVAVILGKFFGNGKNLCKLVSYIYVRARARHLRQTVDVPFDFFFKSLHVYRHFLQKFAYKPVIGTFAVVNPKKTYKQAEVRL